jgi:hypothetical protein
MTGMMVAMLIIMLVVMSSMYRQKQLNPVPIGSSANSAVLDILAGASWYWKRAVFAINDSTSCCCYPRL